MNNTQLSTEEAGVPHKELPPPDDEHAATSQHLSDEEILRRVDQEMGMDEGSGAETRSQLIAFGVTLVAFLYVGILLLSRVPPVEAARASGTPVLAAPSPSAPRWVNWTYSMEEGQARARRDHTKVLIDFYTDWCPACKWVDSAVYTRPDVLAEAQNVSMVKINAEGRPDLAKRYNIHVYPSFVWTDENGNETARHDGSTPASQFAPLMAQNR